MSEFLWILGIFCLSMLLWVLLSGGEDRPTDKDDGWWDV